MNISEFFGLLDKNNAEYEELCDSIKYMRDHYRFEIQSKNNNLSGIVTDMLDRDIFPIVDKKLGVLIGIDRSHTLLRARLYTYHKRAANPEQDPYVNEILAADNYISENMGWFISSMDRGRIVIGFTYRPDSYDKTTLPFYKLSYSV